MVLGIHTESRSLNVLWPFVLVPIVRATERLGWRARSYWAIAAVGVATSKIWFLYYETPPPLSDVIYLASHGPWMSTAAWAVQGAVCLVIAVVFWYTLLDGRLTVARFAAHSRLDRRRLLTTAGVALLVPAVMTAGVVAVTDRDAAKAAKAARDATVSGAPVASAPPARRRPRTRRTRQLAARRRLECQRRERRRRTHARRPQCSRRRTGLWPGCRRVMLA